MILNLAHRVRVYFHDHLPTRNNILQVAATATFLTYTWTLFVSFWEFPSWIFFLNTGQIFSIYAYSFIVNFIESVLLVISMVFLSIVLPVGWWKAQFVPMSVVTMFGLMASLILRLQLYRLPTSRDGFVSGQFAWWCAMLGILVVLLLVLSRIEFLRMWISDFADRFVVFVYIYLPLTAISFAVIIIRSLG